MLYQYPEPDFTCLTERKPPWVDLRHRPVPFFIRSLTLGKIPSSGSAKSTAILTLLKSGRADTNWTLPSRLADNPMAWLIQVTFLPWTLGTLPEWGRRKRCGGG